MSGRNKRKGPPHGYNNRDYRTNPKQNLIRNNHQYFEGIYRNRWIVQTLTSLIGCKIEAELVEGITYEGILRTVSPKLDFVLELAAIKSSPDKLLKDSLEVTLVLNWDRIVNIAIIEGATAEHNDIFRLDSEIAKVHVNGNGDRKELQPFQFDDEGLAPPIQELDKNDKGNGWAVEDMFETNEQKFNIGTSYNPEMTEYTTPLVLSGSASDQVRIEKAEMKVKEIEYSSTQEYGLVNDDGTEEEMFSSVARTNEPSSMEFPTECAQEDETEDNPGAPQISEMDERKSPGEVGESKSGNESGSATELVQDEATDEHKEKNIGKFKLNPDALEFKPFQQNTSSSSSSNSSPSSSAPPAPPTVTHSTSSNRPQRLKGNNSRMQQSRQPLFQEVYSSYIPPRILHPQTSPMTAASTGFVSVIRPSPYGTQVIGHQGNQTFYSIPTSLPGTPTHPQQIGQTALLGHPAISPALAPHTLGMGTQGHSVVYVPLPYAPLGQISPTPSSGIMAYPQQTQGGK